MARRGKCAELACLKVADVYVEPAVAVDVGARDAGSRPDVHRVSEGRLGDVPERPVAVVQEEAIGVALDVAGRSVVEIVRRVAPGADVQVLEAVVVDIAGYDPCAEALEATTPASSATSENSRLPSLR